MKLTIEHLAPYLPYGLKMRFENSKGREITLTGITNQGDFGNTITDGHGAMWLESCGFKPLLMPLSDLINSDLIKEWQKEHDIQYLTDYKNLSLELKGSTRIDILCYPLEFIIDLFKHHFDVFGLIEAGLAIDINTLEQTKTK